MFLFISDSQTPGLYQSFLFLYITLMSNSDPRIHVAPLFKNGHIGSFFAGITKPIVTNIEAWPLLKVMSSALH